MDLLWRWLAGTDTIIPLTTERELLHEGSLQNNCVGSYGDVVSEGRTYIYRVLYPERATLSVAFRHGNWELDEIKGPSNCSVSRATRRHVLRWLAHTPRLPRRVADPEERMRVPFEG